MTRIRLMALVAFSGLFPSHASADSPFMMSPGAFSNQMAIPSMMNRLEKSHQTIFGQSTAESLGKPSRNLSASVGANGVVQFAPDSSVKFAQRMASAYPQDMRPEAERVFKELLVGYHKIEMQFGIPKFDVAGAVAAFLAGNYMAYRNVDFPDENFKPLVSQMRSIILSNPEFVRAPATEKQEMYEQMAIFGMFMATTQMALKEKPNAQASNSMRQAAKGYLEQFLKTDADRVEITAQGLVVR